MLPACEAAMRKIFNVCGARPNFMKIAPLVHAMERSAQLRSTIVHTGQHYSPGLSDVFFEELRIPRPDISLEVGSLPRTEQIALIEERFTPVVAKEAPQLIVVVGDVNSTVACARVGRRFGVPVAHVESGLRSFDLDMPEEHNRIETDRLSDVLYVSEESGMTNLVSCCSSAAKRTNRIRDHANTAAKTCTPAITPQSMTRCSPGDHTAGRRTRPCC